MAIHRRRRAGGLSRPLGLVDWGAIIGGGAIGLACLVTLTALYLAAAHQSGVGFVGNNLQWWVGGTAIFCMALAGLCAAMFAGVGLLGGALNAMCVWAITVVAAFAAGAPTLYGAFQHAANGATRNLDGAIPGTSLWNGFFFFAVGAAAALIGGVVGGLLSEPRAVADGATHDEYVARSEPYPEAERTRVVERDYERH